MGLVDIFPEIQLGRLSIQPQPNRKIPRPPLRSRFAGYLRKFETVEKNNTTKLPISKSSVSISIQLVKVNIDRFINRCIISY